MAVIIYQKARNSYRPQGLPSKRRWHCFPISCCGSGASRVRIFITYSPSQSNARIQNANARNNDPIVYFAFNPKMETLGFV
jgi:hypothetical protein